MSYNEIKKLAKELGISAVGNRKELVKKILTNNSTTESVEVEDDNSITPVLSDPIGATWAYKTDRGIYYTSESSSGSVIKMKPASEWGNVADFEGPSPAGEIAKFGHLENDYPDFKPYTVLSDRDICGEKENSEDNHVEQNQGLPYRRRNRQVLPEIQRYSY